MLSNNPASRNLSNEDYMWPLEEEDQEGTTAGSCPMLLSPSLSDGTCFDYVDGESDAVYVQCRRPEDTPKSFELYSIPEDLDFPFTSCEQTTFFTAKPDKSLFVNIKNSSPLNIGRVESSNS
ncbi:hypothetical protein GpartN1_g3875.t1 [Galdieria partita]|uniref:Uncharacterized protein n=1 Tax=Galdieria partita TaxID=83374 RepID=A0A9C7UQL9_9RHOD|nr:hypothetical protein GpartN1_g3875.t1 [Galdieria partita]